MRQKPECLFMLMLCVRSVLTHISSNSCFSVSESLIELKFGGLHCCESVNVLFLFFLNYNSDSLNIWLPSASQISAGISQI